MIENSADYASEKVIDAILGGAVPLVVGSDLAQFGIPSEVILRAAGISDALRMLIETQAEALDQIRAAGHNWMNQSDGPLAWEEQACQQIVGGVVALATNSLPGTRTV